MEYKIPKGVFDVLPKEPQSEDEWRNSDHWQYIESVLRKCAADYGFKEIRTLFLSGLNCLCVEWEKALTLSLKRCILF
jgi:hypothetical protein